MSSAGKSPFDSAVEKGRLAALAGHPVTANPYRDLWKPDGRLTYSRAWHNAWMDGYRMGQRERCDSEESLSNTQEIPCDCS